MDALIAIENVTKVYNTGAPDEFAALTPTTLSIEKGDAVVLKGPSGSGKTTLLSLMGCMSRPTAGRILVQGRDVAKLPERFLTGIRRETFGFIFQHLNLITEISAVENVMLPLYPGGMGLDEIRGRADRLLDRFGLAAKAKRRVRTLSGGERQRVAIARALINDPAVIIADEPTAHLDRKLSAELLGLLGDLKTEGRTVIIATHDPLVLASSFIGQIVEMQNGAVTGAYRP